MEFNTISIKSFICDLPRVINENFGKIKNFIESIYDSATGTLKADTANIRGQISANTVKSNNIEVNGAITIKKNGDIIIEYKDPSTNLYNIINVARDIVELQNKVKALENN
jgi:hypothetical protein